MMKTVRQLYLGLAVLTMVPAIAAAQEFDAKKMRAGQTVLVRDVSGAETKGVIQSVEASKLVVKYGAGRFQDPGDPARMLNDTRAFTPTDVSLVRRPGPIWDGALKGALIGLIPVVAIEAYGCYGCGQGEFNIVAVSAAIGLGIDAAWGPKTVYRNPGQARKMALVPLIGRSRRGVAASIRF